MTPSDLKSAPTLPGPESGERPSDRDIRTDGLLGSVIDGRYLVERVIGEGGMGIVYRARHRVIDKRVAIKVLRTEMARDQEMTARFLQEARAASTIGDGHIVDVSDLGVLPDGSTYFVMEYLDGQSLTDLLQREPRLPLPRAIHIAKQIARGLGAAHAAGIVHRDLKPDNVMLIARGDDADFVKILDFGIAKVGSQANKLTRAGSVFGTPHYMSPEQASGTPVDARTDVYALGVILYEAVAGNVPFDAEQFMGILSQHLYKAPTPLIAASKRTDVPPAFEAVVMRCLAKSPEQRYESMDALVTDLEAVERGVTPVAVLNVLPDRASFFEPPTGVSGVSLGPDAAAPPRRVWPWVIGIAATSLAVALAVALSIAKREGERAVAPATTTSVAADVPPLRSGDAPPPSGDVVAAAPSAAPPPSASAPVEKKLVVLNVEPADAHASEGQADLGAAPVLVWLKKGEVRTLTLSRSGFAPRTESFDESTLTASETKRSVKLVPLPSRSAGKGSKSTKSSAPGAVFTDHDPDPWKRGM